jgi:hypothetical protein
LPEKGILVFIHVILLLYGGLYAVQEGVEVLFSMMNPTR